MQRGQTPQISRGVKITFSRFGQIISLIFSMNIHIPHSDTLSQKQNKYKCPSVHFGVAMLLLVRPKQPDKKIFSASFIVFFLGLPYTPSKPARIYSFFQPLVQSCSCCSGFVYVHPAIPSFRYTGAVTFEGLLLKRRLQYSLILLLSAKVAFTLP